MTPMQKETMSRHVAHQLVREEMQRLRDIFSQQGIKVGRTPYAEAAHTALFNHLWTLLEENYQLEVLEEHYLLEDG